MTDPDSNNNEEPILGPDGKPLTGKALKKARRALKVKNEKGGGSNPNEVKNQTNPTEKKSPKQTNNNPQVQKLQRQRQNSQSAKKPQNSQKQNLAPKNSKPVKQPQQRQKRVYQVKNITSKIKTQFHYNEELHESIIKIGDSFKDFSIRNEVTETVKINEDSLKLTNPISHAFFQFGLKVSNLARSNSSQKTAIEFCQTLIEYIEGFVLNTTTNQDFLTQMRQDFKSQVGFLAKSTSFGIALGNVIRWFKFLITNNEDIREKSTKFEVSILKQHLVTEVHDFMKGHIIESMKFIVNTSYERVLKRVTSDETIVLYKPDLLVVSSVKNAIEKHGMFCKIVIVDDPEDPLGCWGYGKLKELEKSEDRFSLRVLYAPIHACNRLFSSKHIAHTLLSCEGILQNGNVLADAGSSIVALFSKMNSVPVSVFCESYKFHIDIQTDSVHKNALVTPKKNAETSIEKSRVLYDMTPSQHVSVIITDVHSGCLSTSGVPIILHDREW